MKNLRITLAALALVMAGSVSSFAQTAEEIVKKHLTAIGGEDAWKKINAVRMEGNINAQGMEIPVIITQVQNKGMRQEYTFSGMTGYMIVTPKEGWNYTPGGPNGAEAMTADQVKEMQDMMNVRGEFVDYKGNGSKIELLGKDEIEGTEVYKLKVTDKDGKEKTMYIDTKDFFLIRQSQKMTADGKEMDQVFDYSNYQKQAGGVLFPMTLGAMGGEITMTKIEVNPKVDEAIFKPAN